MAGGGRSNRSTLPIRSPGTGPASIVGRCRECQNAGGPTLSLKRPRLAVPFYPPFERRLTQWSESKTESILKPRQESRKSFYPNPLRALAGRFHPPLAEKRSVIMRAMPRCVQPIIDNLILSESHGCLRRASPATGLRSRCAPPTRPSLPSATRPPKWLGYLRSGSRCEIPCCVALPTAPCDGRSETEAKIVALRGRGRSDCGIRTARWRAAFRSPDRCRAPRPPGVRR